MSFHANPVGTEVRVECSKRDLDPCYRLEKPTSWTGLDDWSTERNLRERIKKPRAVKNQWLRAQEKN